MEIMERSYLSFVSIMLSCRRFVGHGTSVIFVVYGTSAIVGFKVSQHHCSEGSVVPNVMQLYGGNV